MTLKNKCDDNCINANNFKSQLGKTVASNLTWQLVNEYFNNNEITIKLYAGMLNDAIDQPAYAKAANKLTELSNSSRTRILVAQPDGTVTYDSSKGVLNTFAKAKKKEINENHNTRPSMMSAQLTCDGRGNEIKFSSSTNQIEVYCARTIVDNYGNNKGTVRLSKSVAA